MKILKELENGARYVEHQERSYRGDTLECKYYWYEDCICTQGRRWVSSAGSGSYAVQCSTCTERMNTWAKTQRRVRYHVVRRIHPLKLECWVDGRWVSYDRLQARDIRDETMVRKNGKELRIRIDYKAVGGPTWINSFEVDACGVLVRWIGCTHTASIEKAQTWIAEQCDGSLRDFWLV